MINEEVKVINKIYESIMRMEGCEYDSFEYEYISNKDEGWTSMGLVYKLNNSIVLQNNFKHIDSDLLEKLSEQLKIMMFEHTGGEFTKFILFFENNEIKTKFEYQPQSLI